MPDASSHAPPASPPPAHPAAQAATAAAVRRGARERLTRWLLAGPAQRREGPQTGAVAGVVDAAAAPAYVYPEITGYYLQWLAWRAFAGTSRDLLAPRAQAAQSWLTRWAGDPAPPTRVYPMPHDDWRNRASFQFDLAMVMRGVASAASAGLLVPDPRLIARLDAQLLALRQADGTLAACRVTDRAAALPQRWSTQAGAFLAKAAAGILAASDCPGVSRTLIAAAQDTLAHAEQDLRDRPHDEAHPLLYAIEGVIARAPAARPRLALAPAAGALDRLLATRDAAGTPREHARAGGQPRNDVLAQAVRAGVMLAALDVPGAPSRSLLESMAGTLASRVGVDALPFAATTVTGESNVWATMFGEQALGLLELPADAVARARALIV